MTRFPLRGKEQDTLIHELYVCFVNENDEETLGPEDWECLFSSCLGWDYGIPIPYWPSLLPHSLPLLTPSSSFLKSHFHPSCTWPSSVPVHATTTSHHLFFFWWRLLSVFLSIWPLCAIKHHCTNLFFHQPTTHLAIHILFPHLYSPNSLYTIMRLPNVTVFSVYLFKPSIHFLPVNPSTEHPPASLWQKYLFLSPLQGNENLGCYLSIPQGRLYLVILKHSC